MFNATYKDREGFDATFLNPGKLDGQVFLPRLGTALAKLTAPLLANSGKNVLDYHHYSVVMHRTRRFAIYSAANVDFDGRFAMTPTEGCLANRSADRCRGPGHRGGLHQ